MLLYYLRGSKPYFVGDVVGQTGGIVVDWLRLERHDGPQLMRLQQLHAANNGLFFRVESLEFVELVTL